MEPKEKARELVKKFYNELTNHMQWDEAKEAAKITVQFTINELFGIINDKASVRVTDAIKPTVKFLQQVEAEIENL